MAVATSSVAECAAAAAQSASALPLTDSNEHALPAKRRRVTLDDVEQELGVAGLANPCMSALFGTKRRTSIEDQFAKRRRTESASSASETSSEALVPSGHRRRLMSEYDLSQALVPHMPVHVSSEAAPRPKLLVPVGPVPISFTFASNGWLLAELPPHWRPFVFVPGLGAAEVAGVAIDRKGTAYLISAVGQVLAVVLAQSLAKTHGSTNVQAGSSASHALQDEVKIELLSAGSKAGDVSMQQPAVSLDAADVAIPEDMDEDL